MNDKDGLELFPEMFRRMRRTVLMRSIILLLSAVLAIAAWMYAYHYLGGRSGPVYLIGVFVILGVAFLYAPRVEQQVVCPACGESLEDADGWALFLKSCPHCGVRYEK